MSQLLTYQKAFARLVTDAEMRQVVFAGDTRPLAELGLSAEQQQYFLQMDHKRVEIFSRLLVTNRLGKAMDGLPWTTKILGSELGQIAYEFNQASPPKDAKKYREAMAFGVYLQERFRHIPPTPPYLQDVLNYEMSVLEIRFDADGYRTVSSSKNPAAYLHLLRSAGTSENLIPFRLNIRIVALNYDVESLGRDLERGKTRPAVKKQAMLVLLKVDSSGSVVQTRINYRTFAFIQACDGSTPFGAIVYSLAREFHEDTPRRMPGFRGQCLSLCKSLVEQGVIGLGYGAFSEQSGESSGHVRSLG
ncbi:MAG: hypothetical protein IT329_06485 [Caldilineaceae bacterium]|nr:hypothetical protein [Caldilineaceae bacterium]